MNPSSQNSHNKDLGNQFRTLSYLHLKPEYFFPNHHSNKLEQFCDSNCKLGYHLQSNNIVQKIYLLEKA